MYKSHPGQTPAPSSLDWALSYVALGWHVFPVAWLRDGQCGCGDPHDGSDPRLTASGVAKHPLIRQGHHAATNDPRTVREWWSRWPEAGIGVAVKPSGLCVLDVDIGEGKNGDVTLSQMSAAGLLPAAPRSRTGGGGWHLVYRHPPAAPAVRKIRPTLDGVTWDGLDVLSDGYFIAPPSTHKSGARYTWIDQPEHVPPAPPILERVLVETTRARAERMEYDGGEPASPELINEAWRQLLEMGPSIKGQGGDQHAYGVGALLLNDFNLPWDQAWALALGWRDAFPENTWTDEALRTKMQNAGNYSAGARGCRRDDYEIHQHGIRRSSAPSPQDALQQLEVRTGPSDFLDQIKAALADVQAYNGSGETAPAPEPLFTSTAALFGKEFPPKKWLVRGVVPEAGMGMIAGEPKSTKTWCAIELGLCIANNWEAFGEFGTGPRRPAVFFLAEDGEQGYRARVGALCQARGVDPTQATTMLHHVCRKTIDLSDELDLAHVLASVRALPEAPSFIVLDPLRDLHNDDENDSAAMALINKRLRCLRDLTGATVLYVHHSGKQSPGGGKRRGGQRARGSGALHGGTDFGMYLSAPDTDNRTHWCSATEIETRDGGSAGFVNIELRVRDDQHGQAEHAKWSISREEIGDDKSNDKLAERVASAMVELDKVATVADIRNKLRNEKIHDVAQALQAMRVGKLVVEVTNAQGQTIGYRLNDPIRAHLESTKR